MIRNRLAFAIRVRRKIDFVGLRRRFLQLLHNFFFARRHHQLRLKRPLLQLHAKLVLGQIHDVPHRSPHFESLAQILFDRLRLGRRLHDHQCFARCCHSLTQFPLSTFHRCLCDSPHSRLLSLSTLTVTRQPAFRSAPRSMLRVARPCARRLEKRPQVLHPTTEYHCISTAGAFFSRAASRYLQCKNPSRLVNRRKSSQHFQSIDLERKPTTVAEPGLRQLLANLPVIRKISSRAPLASCPMTRSPIPVLHIVRT